MRYPSSTLVVFSMRKSYKSQFYWCFYLFHRWINLEHEISSSSHGIDIHHISLILYPGLGNPKFFQVTSSAQVSKSVMDKISGAARKTHRIRPTARNAEMLRRSPLTAEHPGLCEEEPSLVTFSASKPHTRVAATFLTYICVCPHQVLSTLSRQPSRSLKESRLASILPLLLLQGCWDLDGDDRLDCQRSLSEKRTSKHSMSKVERL